MKHNIEYRYGNVKLRPIERNDLELLRGWRNNKENTRYLRQIGQISSDMQLGWYEKYLSTNDELGFCIEECDELNRMVGSVFLYDIHDNQAEFGRFLIGDNAAHGRKIGFNACYGVLQIGFKILQLKNIVLRCYEKNFSAMNIYKQVGFEEVSKHLVINHGGLPDGIECVMKIEHAI